MLEVVRQLHFYNMLLVLAAGSIAGIWGLILYFRERRKARRGVSLPAPSEENGDLGDLSGGAEPLQSSAGQAVVLPKVKLNRLWRISLIVTVIFGALQALLGITLVLLGRQPSGHLYYLHYVYGGIVALAIPVAITYATSGKNPRRDILIYSIAALVLVAAGARALMTG